MADNGKARAYFQDCAKFKGLISAYIDNETGTSESEAVSGHLAECPSCKRELANLYAVREMVKNIYAPKENVDFSASIMSHINVCGGKGKACKKGKTPVSVITFRYGMVAALVFFALGATVFYSQTQTKKMLAEKRKFDTYVVEHSIQTAGNIDAASQVIAVNFEK